MKKSTRRFSWWHLLATIVGFLFGLLIFLPGQYIEEYLQETLPEGVEWEAMHTSGISLVLDNVRFETKEKRVIQLQQVTFSPSISPLLSGGVGGDFLLNDAETILNGSVLFSDSGQHWSWKSDNLELEKIRKWFSIQQSSALKGVVRGEGSLILESGSGKIKSADAEIDIIKLTGWGVTLESGGSSLKFDKGKGTLAVSVVGDIHADGSIRFTLNEQHPARSTLGGKLQLKAGESGNNREIVKELLPDGQKALVEISGTVADPHWDLSKLM